MSKTIMPTVPDLLRSIGETLENVVTPALVGNAELSAVTTIRHLLRYATFRLDREGQALLDEAKLLRGLLSEGAAYLKSRPASDTVSSDLVIAIDSTLAQRRDPDLYPTLTLMADEVGVLRQHVCDFLAILRSAGASGRGAAGEEQLQSVRRYLSWQIEQESKIIEPSFVGQGARR